MNIATRIRFSTDLQLMFEEERISVYLEREIEFADRPKYKRKCDRRSLIREELAKRGLLE